MNSLARSAVALLATAAITSPAPADSATGPFMVVNAASSQLGPVPRGALLSIVMAGRFDFVQPRTFDPWETDQTPEGLHVEATCGPDGAPMRLPIRSIGSDRFGSTRIEVYYPNSMGPEPFGTCMDSGRSGFWVYPPQGEPMMIETETVTAHPGVFTIGTLGDIPDGPHVDGESGVPTPFITCNLRLPGVPGACPVRTNGKPAQLLLSLTGAEAFACDPCVGSPLIFELAPVVGGVTGTFVPQTLRSVVWADIGLEKATIILRSDTAPGEYRLRVRNTIRPEFPLPLKVEFGLPVG